MRLLVPVAATAVFVAALAASPAGAVVSQRYTDCVARAGSNTVQLGVCAQSELGAQDARLNKAYQQVMRQLARTPARRDALRRAQRSWLAQRDYQCKIDGETIDTDCLIRKTDERADQLEAQIRF